MITYTDSNMGERIPRLPMQGWNDLVILFTTDAVLMKLLFGTSNQHLQWVNKV